MYDGAYDSAEIPAAKTAGAIAMSYYIVGPFAASSASPGPVRGAGLGSVLNWERAPNALVGATRAQGQAIGQEALAAIDPACPRDGSVGIYFSVDVNVAMGSVAVCDECFRGINDILAGKFKVKCYAEGAVIDHLVSLGLVQGKQWLSASSSFPGYNPSDVNVCMVQQIATDVPNTDRNVVTDPYALDAWWPDGSIYGVDLDATQNQMLTDLHNWLVNGTAPGQVNEGGTIAAALETAQKLVNVIAAFRQDVDTQLAALQQQIAALPAPSGGGTSSAPTAFTGTVQLTASH